MAKRIRKPSETCVDCGNSCWGRTRSGKQNEPRCHACANRNKTHVAHAPACGTRAAYRSGCRCVDCRTANTAECKAQRSARKARGMLAQKRRTDRVYLKPETYPNCVVCGEVVINGRVRSDSPMHKACNPRRRWIAISRGDRLAIYERDDSICQLCDGPVDLSLPWTDRWSATLDHIIPYSLGGADDPSNLRLAHRSCNSRRGVTLV